MATLSTDRCSTDFVRSLADKGMKGVRINSAHVMPDDIMQMVATVRAVDPSIKILMDTKGSEIRTTDLIAPISFSLGDTTTIAGIDNITTQQRICLTAQAVENHLKPGMQIVFDDGELIFEVSSVCQSTINAKCIRAGILGARKTVNIPDCQLPPLPAVSERDRINIIAGIKAGIDIIAHSFVRDVHDIEAVRQLISDTDISLFAKIECPQAINNLNEIANAADGLLVARGDLGTCMPLSEIPVLQYTITSHCRSISRPFIVSTQILQSMMSSPSPTRAEVSDIALAVMQGADWLLLCGETALGKYPVECVDIMQQTINSVQQHSLRCKI